MQKHFTSKGRQLLFNLTILFALGACVLSSCKEEKHSLEHDPNKPSVFHDYSPKEGAVRTRLYIRGENFGTDVSKIKVYIGEKELKVIGANGTEIFCMVPRKTTSGDVRVVIDGNEHTFAEPFVYTSTITVGTLVGNVNELGQSSIVNGTFEEAGFDLPTWLLFEPGENSLFVVERDRAVRKVDLNERMVSTLITNGQAAFRRIQTATLSPDNDTLFIVDDHGQNNTTKPAIAYTLRSENYRRVYPYIYDRTSYSCASHPIDNIMFFNTHWGGGIQKAFINPLTKELTSKELFKTSSANVHPNIFFHPSGNFAYLMVGNVIWKTMYNWTTQELEPAVVFVGQYNVKGDVDAIGTSARFGLLNQGVFVKNDKYVGQADQYDFYVADIDNHSIRTISPMGEVSTFAGKGSPASDGKKEGYIDGDLRREARFNKPTGIAYDEANQIFYISEEVNKRIRTIGVE